MTHNEGLAVRKVEDVWAEGDPEEYRSSATFEVKQVGSRKFEIYRTVNGARQHFDTISQMRLRSLYEPIRPNQTPDAEGFTTYISSATVEAIRWTAATVMLQIGEKQVKLRKGDFITREEGENDEYAVKPASDFEDKLRV